METQKTETGKDRTVFQKRKVNREWVWVIDPDPVDWDEEVK